MSADEHSTVAAHTPLSEIVDTTCKVMTKAGDRIDQLIESVNTLHAERNRLRALNSELLDALRSVRTYVQDCIENGHDRTMLGNMYGARDDIDAAITKAQP